MGPEPEKKEVCQYKKIVSKKNILYKRDELIINLQLVFMEMSDLYNIDSFSYEDLEVWTTITKHPAVQNKLNSK